MPVGGEMREHGDGLDGLAEPHLVTEDHPALGQREPRAEGLVPTERDPPVRVVEPLRVHPVRDLGGQEPLGGLDVGRAPGDLGELAVVLRGPQLEVHPRLGVGRGLPQQVGGCLREQHRYALGDRVTRQRAEFRDGGEGALPSGPAREGHAQPPGGRTGRREKRLEPAVELRGGVHGPAQLGSGLDEPAQRDDEGGGPRFGVVDVDPYGHGLLDRAGDLPGGGERLVGGLGSDARYLPQLVPARVEHGTHRSEPRRLKGPEPEPPLGDVLQPRDRDALKLLGDQLGEDRREGRTHLVDGPRVIVEHSSCEPAQPLAPPDDRTALPPHRYGAVDRPLTLRHDAPRVPYAAMSGHPSTGDRQSGRTTSGPIARPVRRGASAMRGLREDGGTRTPRPPRR